MNLRKLRDVVEAMKRRLNPVGNERFVVVRSWETDDDALMRMGIDPTDRMIEPFFVRLTEADERLA